MGYRNYKGSNNRKSNYYHKKNRKTDRNDNPICPVCKKQVKELYNAICHSDSGKATHFDCIIKIIQQQEQLAPHEKVCYLGNGSFGIIRQQKSTDFFPFIIRKRIQYEDPHLTPGWRKPLKSKMLEKSASK